MVNSSFHQQLLVTPFQTAICGCAQDFGLICFSIVLVLVLVLSETVLVLVIESRQPAELGDEFRFEMQTGASCGAASAGWR